MTTDDRMLDELATAVTARLLAEGVPQGYARSEIIAIRHSLHDADDRLSRLLRATDEWEERPE